MRATFARRLCERLQKPAQDAVSCCRDLVQQTQRSCVAAGLLASDCGVIAVRVLQQAHSQDLLKLQVIAVTCSRSMGFGFALAGDASGCRRNMMLRQPVKGEPGIQVHEETWSLRLNKSAQAAACD